MRRLRDGVLASLRPSCRRPALRLACHLVFPDCHVTTAGRPAPRPLCRSAYTPRPPHRSAGQHTPPAPRRRSAYPPPPPAAALPVSIPPPHPGRSAGQHTPPRPLPPLCRSAYTPPPPATALPVSIHLLTPLISPAHTIYTTPIQFYLHLICRRLSSCKPES